MVITTKPRYTPHAVMTLKGYRPVTKTEAFPAGLHPWECPIRERCTAVRLTTDSGARWYGVERAYINSELRMVVVGFDSRFEEMAKWEEASRE